MAIEINTKLSESSLNCFMNALNASKSEKRSGIGGTFDVSHQIPMSRMNRLISDFPRIQIIPISHNCKLIK